MFNAYDVADDKQPNISKLAILYSKLNSSVKQFIPNKKTPTQNPVHMGQCISVPNQSEYSEIFSLASSKMLPYTKICVIPYADSIKYNNSI